MIINISRSQFFQQCRRKQWFYDQGLVQLGLTEPLAMGTAYHKGTAILTSKRDANLAVQTAEETYRAEMAKIPLILPEERPLHEANIDVIKRMLTAQARQYAKDTWTVLKPEVEFLVGLPETEHHCWFCHKLRWPDIPFEHCPTMHDYKWFEPDDREEARKHPSCFQPHYLRGRTDGVLQWNNLVWILERKTSGMKQNIFWDQWYLSHQLSAYVYGVRKSTNLPVHGVLLEKMPKPARNQNPTTFDYSPEREPYLRSEADLNEFEAEIIAIASDYERAATIGRSAFYRNPQACIDYNRRCDYWETCKRGGTPNPGEYRTRDQDYVEEAYYDVLGIPNPNKKEVQVAST